MSTVIDEKIVSLKFDNKQFESGVRDTMSTLDKLKASLNFDGATKSFESIEVASSKVRMTGMSDALETVRVKFSALEVMAVTALTNITNSAISTGQQLIKSLSTDQIMAGWSKYEQKTASVQTIMNATGKSIDEVNAYLAKLMWFSDETSYGFTDMTAALGQMTASGGDIDKLIPLIMGVANATAYAGKGAAEFSRTMYNLNQSYAAGALQYMDWRSLELAGVASKELKQIFIDTAVAMGKIKEGQVTIANFSQTLKDRWADTAVMEAAFGKFGEMTEGVYQLVQSGAVEYASEGIEQLSGQYSEVAEKAFRSAQEAKSFTEAIEATKDAVSSGWMRTFEILFGNYEEAKVLWTDLCEYLWEVFASSAGGRNELLSDALESNWSKLTTMLGNAGFSIADFRKQIDAVAGDAINIDALIEEFGSLDEAIRAGKVGSDILKKALDSLAVTTDTAALSTDKLNRTLWWGMAGDDVVELQTALEALGHSLGETGIDGIMGAHTYKAIREFQAASGLLVDGIAGPATIKALKAAAAEYNNLNASMVSQTGNVDDAAESWKELVDEITKPSGRELLIEAFFNTLNGVKKVIDTVKAAWSNVFPPATADRIYAIAEKIRNLSTRLVMSDETAGKLSRTLEGLFTILDIIGVIVSKTITTTLKLFGESVSDVEIDILGFTASIGDSIVAFKEWLDENDKIQQGIDKLVEIIQKCIDKIMEWVSAIKEIPFVSDLITEVKTRVEQLQKAFTELPSAEEIIRRLGQAFTDLKSGMIGGKHVTEWIESFNALPGVQTAMAKLSEIVDKVKESFGGFESVGEDSMAGLIAGLQNGAANIWETIKTVALNMLQTIKDFLGINSPSVEFYKIGMYAISGLINGLKNGEFSLKLIIREVAMLLINTICDALGIHSPSTIFMGIGAFMIAGLIIGILSSQPEVVETIKEFASTLISTIKDKLGVKPKEAGEKTMQDFIDGFKSKFSEVWETVKEFGKTFSEKIEEYIGPALLIGAGAGIILLANVLSKAFQVITSPISTFTAMMKSASGAFKALEGSFKATTLIKNSFAIMICAGAIAVLAGAVAILASIDEQGKLWSAVGAVAALSAVLAGFAFVFEKIGNMGLNLSGIVTLVALAAAVHILVLALLQLEKVEGDKVWKNLGILAGIAVGLGVIVGVMGALVPQLSAGGIMLIAYAAAILLLVKSLAEIATVTASIDVGKTIGLLLSIMAGLALIALASKNVGSGAAVTLLAAVAALKLMASAIAGISEIDTKTITDNIGAFIAVFAMLGTLMLTAGLSTMISGGGMGQAGVAILLMTASLLVIAEALKKFAELDAAGGLDKGIDAILNLLEGFLLITLALGVVKKGAAQAGVAILLMSGAILILSGAAMILGKIPAPELEQGLDALVTMLAMLAIVTAATGFAKPDSMKTVIAITAAIAVLAIALAGLSAVDPDKLLGATIALGVVMGLLAIVIAQAGKLTKSSGQILSVAAIIGALVIGLAVLAHFDAVNVAVGAAGLSAVMLTLVAVMKTMKGIRSNTLNQVTILTAVVAGLALCMAVMAMNDWTSLVASAAALAIVLGSIVYATKHVDKLTKKTLESTVILAAVVAALGIVLALMAMNDWTSLVAASGALSVVLGVLTVALIALGKAGPSINSASTSLLVASAAFLVIAAALAILTPALIKLSEIKMVDLIKAIGALALAFLAIGGSAILLGGLAPVTLALAIAMGIFGVACVALAASLVIFTAGMEAMVAIMPKATGVFNEFLDILSTAVVTLASTVAQAIANFLTTIAAYAPQISAAITVILTAILTTIRVVAPQIIATFVTIVSSMLDAVETLAPKIVSAAVTIITSILDGIEQTVSKLLECLNVMLTSMLEFLVDAVPKMVDAGMQIITGILRGIANNIQRVVEAGADIVINFIKGVSNKLPAIIDAAFKLIISFVNGLADAIRGNSVALNQAAYNLVSAISTGIVNNLSTIVDRGRNIVAKVASGISEKVKDLIQSGKDAVAGFVQGIKDKLTDIAQAGRDLAETVITALKKRLGIFSPSRVFAEMGRYVDEGFVQGISDYAVDVYRASEDLGDQAINGMSGAISKIAELVNSDIDTQPTIRPVLDLSSVEAGASRLDTLFSRSQALSVSASMSSSSSSGNQNGANNANTGNTYQFTQNNYSPKALSSIEIYRQTKNQFSTLERMATV